MESVPSTATQRPGPPCPAPATPATSGRATTHRRRRVPVSIHAAPPAAAMILVCECSPFSPTPHPGPPTAPVNVISSVNGTSVHLEWDRPLDTGGRSDLQYSVLCQKCAGEGGPCESCDSHPGSTNGGKTGASVAAGSGGMVERSGTAAIRFIPRQSGLKEPRVTVLNLVAHSNYSFRILATNAVTLQSNEPSLFATANITTNQAGRAPQSSRSRIFKHHQSGGHRWRSDVCFYCEGQLGNEFLPISLVVLLHNY